SVENQGMRVLRLGVRHLELSDRAGLRIDLADQRAGVARVPDVAVLVLDEAVGPGMRRSQSILFDLAGLGIDPAQHVRHLARVPEGSISCRKRIVRARSWRGRRPRLNGNLEWARQQDR